MTLLLTGFGPFPGVKDNPTAAIAKTLNNTRISAMRIESIILPVAISSAFQDSEIACRDDTNAVVCLGVSTKIDKLHLESYAYNQFDSKKGDVEGKGKGKWIIEQKGPDRRETPFSCLSIVESLKDHGILSKASTDPGRYVCNWLYYKRLGKDLPTLFVHVPPVSVSWSMDKLVEATLLVMACVAKTIPLKPKA